MSSKSISDEHKCEDICTAHYHEAELICPYCLYEGSDSFEVIMGEDNESGTDECPECGKKYKYGTEITYRDGGVYTLYYTTFQIEGSDEQP